MKAMVLNKIAPVNKHSLTLMDVPVAHSGERRYRNRGRFSVPIYPL